MSGFTDTVKAAVVSTAALQADQHLRLVTKRLNQIIVDCTKAPDLMQGTPGGQVISHDPVQPHTMTNIDCHFIVVAVCQECAAKARPLLLSLLAEWPGQRIKDGPSYIEIGAFLGDQSLAFRLLALGEVAELWRVIIPETLGFRGKEARDLAGNGFVMHGGMR